MPFGRSRCLRRVPAVGVDGFVSSANRLARLSSQPRPGAGLAVLWLSKCPVHRPSLCQTSSRVERLHKKCESIREHRFPLSIAEHTSVNEKQPFGERFIKKVFVGSVSVTNEKTKPPRHRCRGGLKIYVRSIIRVDRLARTSGPLALYSWRSDGSACYPRAAPSHARPNPMCARLRKAA